MSNETRDRILDCACHLYLEDGLDGFSMRKLAGAVGVTAPALYRYYDNKEAVLVDVVSEAYRRLAGYLYAALRGETPEERFRLAGQAYLRFALDHERLYEVLFAAPEFMGMGEEAPEEIQSQACAVGQFWKDRVRECVDTGVLREQDQDAVAQTLWAHSHGLISLYLRGFLQVGEEGIRRLYQESYHRIVVGLGTPEYAGRVAEAASPTMAPGTPEMTEVG
jgi:AcrR family transcriptional regulator